MTRREYDKLTRAVKCLMNGEPGHDDHNPKYGLWEDGMNALAQMRRQYIRDSIKKKERK